MNRQPPLTPNARLRWQAAQPWLPAGPARVLEVGCGQGSVTARLAARYPGLVALEPDPQSAAVAAARVGQLGEVRTAGTESLRPDERFDLVCAFEVLEHLADDAAALADWCSRLRPGGRLLVSTPAFAARMGAADAAAGHFRRYDPPDMAALLRSHGLAQVEVRCYGGPVGYALEAVRNLLGRRALRRTTAPMATRTAASGRFHQPGLGPTGVLHDRIGRLVAVAGRVAGTRGPALLATGVAPPR